MLLWHHIRDTLYKHDLALMMLTLNVWFLMCLHCNGTVSPFIYLVIFWGLLIWFPRPGGHKIYSSLRSPRDYWLHKQVLKVHLLFFKKTILNLNWLILHTAILSLLRKLSVAKENMKLQWNWWFNCPDWDSVTIKTFPA